MNLAYAFSRGKGRSVWRLESHVLKCLTFHVLKLKLDCVFPFYMAYNSLNLNDCILQVKYL